MGFISTYIVQPFYNLGYYGVTLACYFFGSSVKQEEVSNLLSNVETLPETELIESGVALGNFHEKMGSIEGTMQWRSQKWQEKNSGRSLPFEQRYRLLFLDKLLATEQQKLQKIVEPLLKAKEKAIKISIKCFVPIDHLADYLTKDIMGFAYVSQDECIYYFLMRHYPKRAKLVAKSYDYTPLCYLLLYTVLGFEWYVFIKALAGERYEVQFKTRPLRLYGNYKTSFQHAYLKTTQHIETQVKHSLPLCGNSLVSQPMALMGNTPLADGLMEQNATAIQEAIADPHFYGITHNENDGYLLLPFINALELGSKEVAPLTTTSFCEHVFFAPDLLPSFIYDNMKREMKNDVEVIETNAKKQIKKYKHYSNWMSAILFQFFVYNFVREKLTKGGYPTYWPIGLAQWGMFFLLMLSPFFNTYYPPF